jgi:hypothetical protein
MSGNPWDQLTGTFAAPSAKVVGIPASAADNILIATSSVELCIT